VELFHTGIKRGSPEKIALITGATDGIGKAIAKTLADHGYRIILAARNAVKAEAVIAEITASNPATRLEPIVADLSSLPQVDRLTRAVLERYDRLDVLINNAGVVMPNRQVTTDGFETTFQVNYLSPFILTNSLLPLLRASGAGRIINLSSSVYSLGKFNPALVRDAGRYSAITTYATTKLYLLLFTKSLAERIGAKITANAMHPGIVRTNMSMNTEGFPAIFKIISALALPFAITPEKAAETALLLAASDSVRGISGEYFTNGKMVPTKTKFDTPGNRQLLWDLTMQTWQESRQVLPAN
jgi:NAD(P)-dependent dehydrogenase (short-subunit alcohol dehydrogenase family)